MKYRVTFPDYQGPADEVGILDGLEHLGIRGAALVATWQEPLQAVAIFEFTSDQDLAALQQEVGRYLGDAGTPLVQLAQ